MPNATAQWIGLFKAEDPIRRVSNAAQRNRIANILGGLKGIGCRIDKPTNAEGEGWTIIVDGTSDVANTDTNAFVTSDRLFALGSGDASGTYSDKITGLVPDTEYTYDTASAISHANVRYDTFTDTADGVVKARPHIPLWDTTTKGPAVYILGMTTGGDIVRLLVTDTCAVV